MERALEEYRQELWLRDSVPEPVEIARAAEASRTRQDILQQQRRQLRLQRYEEVIEQYRHGDSLKKIGRTLQIDRRTVRRWIRAGMFPERQRPRPRLTTQLFHELRAQGYRGGRSMVARHASRWRRALPPIAQLSTHKITPKQAAILVSRPAARLTGEQQCLLDRLSTQCPVLLKLQNFAVEFRAVFEKGERAALRSWTTLAQQSEIRSLARFAIGLEKDFSAVVAAVETDWSNGQVEGQINRLKMLKRQMYGRAGFALLRARVLPYVSLRREEYKAA